MQLKTPAGFSFESTVISHGWYLLAPFRYSSAKRALQRVELLDGRPSNLTITHRDGALQIAGTKLTPELRRKLTRMFQLDVATEEFTALAQESPDHAWVARAGFGRLLCGSTLFEDAVKIIATTNTTWRQTMRMAGLLVAKCGRDGAFPEPRDITRLSVDKLQEECRLGYRATSIHRLASGIVDGSIDLSAIADPSQSTEDLFESYKTLPGIGPYGAAHLLAMDGRHDVIAVDSEFRRFVRERYHKGRRVADATMLRRYKKWGRWKYLAYWSELWASVADRLQHVETAGK